MGILNIIFGSLGLLCGVCAAGANAFMGSMASGPGGPPGSLQAVLKDEMQFLDKHLPGYLAVEIGRGVGLILLSILVIVAGIGLLATKSWARWLSVFYAVLSIPLHVGWAVFELGFALPVVQQWQNEYFRRNNMIAPPQGSNVLGGSIGVIGWTILWVVYALILLVFMFLPGLSAAFHEGSRPTRGRRDEGYEEDEDDHPDIDPDYRRRWRDRD
jgi:hypothetical protein